METRERVDNDEVLHRLRDRRRRLLRDAELHAVEGLAVEILHRDEVLTVDLADLVRLDDVRVIEASRDARLVHEHGNELGILGEVLPKPLDDGELAEARAERPRDDREEDVGHAAVTELREQSVLAKVRC